MKTPKLGHYLAKDGAALRVSQVRLLDRLLHHQGHVVGDHESNYVLPQDRKFVPRPEQERNRPLAVQVGSNFVRREGC